MQKPTKRKRKMISLTKVPMSSEKVSIQVLRGGTVLDSTFISEALLSRAEAGAKANNCSLAGYVEASLLFSSAGEDEMTSIALPE